MLEKMNSLETIPDSELSELFVEQSKKFCEYIFSEAPTKQFEGGTDVTGRSKFSIL